jgi:hypothetical protein
MPQEPASPPQDQPNSTEQIRNLLDDPEFYALKSPADRQKALAHFDPDFAKVPVDQVNRIAERIYPEAYAKHERAPKPPTLKMETKQVGLTRTLAGPAETATGIGHMLSLFPRLQSGQITDAEFSSEVLGYLSSYAEPFRQLSTNTEFQRMVERGHPQATKGEIEVNDSVMTGRAINFLSAFFGGDPDQAWKDFQQGEWSGGLASMFAVPVLTLGTAALLKKPMTEEKPTTKTGKAAVKANETLGALIGDTQSLHSGIAGEVHDRPWIANQTRDLLKQAMREMGYTDELPFYKRFQAFFSGEPLQTTQGRWTGAFPSRRSVLGAQRIEHGTAFDVHGNPTPEFLNNLREGNKRILRIASKAVDISHRPFDHVVSEYGTDSIADIKPSIIQTLKDAALDAEKTGNKSQSGALNALAETINKARNIRELNDIKVESNKMIQGALDGTIPGQMIGSTAESIYAWKIAGDAIRQSMYPKLEALSGVDLRKFGEREGAAIAMRDGLYRTYFTEIDPAEAKAVALGYLGNLSESHSLFKHHLVRRALRLIPEPPGEFNLWFREGVGKLGKGGRAESIETVPLEQRFLPASEAPGSAQPFFRIEMGIPEEIIYGKGVTKPGMRYVGEGEVPTGTDAPMAGGSRYQQTLETGTTEKTIPEQIFGRSEAKKRQDAVGKSGQAVPERLFTGKKTKKESRWQYMTGSQEPTETTKTVGPGVIHTNDPKLAYNAMVNLRGYISGVYNYGNVTPFEALPSDIQARHLKALQDLQRQLGQYAIYRYGKTPRRVQITPAKEGKVTKTHKLARYGGAAAAGAAREHEVGSTEQQIQDLLNKYKGGSQPQPQP